MDAEALPTLPELTKALGVGASPARRWGLPAGLALGVAVVAAGLFLWLRGPKAQVVYTGVPARRGDLAVTVDATGTLEAVTTVEVGSEVSGRVLSEGVDVNDEVHKGQIMAEIDPEPLRSAVDQARAQLRGAQDGVQNAQATATESARTQERSQSLGRDGILSQAALDTARGARDRDSASLHVAQENARVAKATLDLAASRLQKATIRAPMDGVVLARLVETGQTVTAGFQTPVLFKMAQDMRKMRLNVDIDEADVSRIRAGEGVVFTVEAYPGRKFPSLVQTLQMNPKVSQNVVTYLAVLTVDNTDRALLPGMTCTATIQAEVRRGVLLVPNAALRFAPPATVKTTVSAADGKHRVWVLRDKVPVPLEVQTGASDGQDTEILGGALTEGMSVLTDSRDPA